MRILAIESATSTPSVAVIDGDRVVSERAASGAPGSEALLPAIAASLREARLSLEALDGFALAIGPGSFTGLRVGLATLKGLAFDDGRPAAPISTLAALARTTGDPRPEAVAVLLDARRGELYAAVWDPGQAPEPRVAEGLYRASELATQLPDRCLLVGDGVEANLAALRRDVGDGIRPAPGGGVGPCAAQVGMLGLRVLASGQGVPAAELVPRYMRRAEAEVRRTGQAVEGPEPE